MRILIGILIYAGSALMVSNIIRYYLFARRARRLRGMTGGRAVLYFPLLLLVMFLAGYLVVGIFGNPDLIMAGILSGGSVFVFLVITLLLYGMDRVDSRETQMIARYEDLKAGVYSLTHDSLAVLQVDLTEDVVEERSGELYDSDRTAQSYTELVEGRMASLLVVLDENAGLFTRQGLLDHFNGGHSSAEEVLFVRRPDGERCFVKMEATLTMQPSTGNIVAFITERKCNDEMVNDTILHKALVEEYELIASVVDGQFSMVIGDQYRLGQIGDLPLTGKGEYTEYIQTRVLPLVVEDLREEMGEALSLDRIRRELTTGEMPYQVDLVCIFGGETYYKSYVYYAVDRRADFYLLMRYDNTEATREQMEKSRQLEAALAEAEAASAAKTVFLSNMSHDIRTPMNAIIGYTGLARKPGTAPEQVLDYLAKIEGSSQHLLALINDVLEMSRIESGKMDLVLAETDLVALMNELRDMFATQMAQKRIDFKVETRELKDRWVLCDGNRLNRVLLNLLSNSFKFTPEGGAVSVILTQEGTRGETMGAYRLRVKDSGIGMSPEFASRVFESFERERTSTVSGIQGTGLGMAITKSIVDLMDGDIRVETEEGKGTEFIVDLDFPLAQRTAPGNDGEETGKELSLDLSSLKLLLVDDNEINLEIGTLILEEAGVTVDTAVNGKEALDRVAASRPGDFDAVLMDVQMPVMNGYEATRAIRRLEDPALAAIPIIALSANAFQEDVQDAKNAGMDGHVSKPLDMAKLKETLAEVLG